MIISPFARWVLGRRGEHDAVECAAVGPWLAEPAHLFDIISLQALNSHGAVAELDRPLHGRKGGSFGVAGILSSFIRNIYIKCAPLSMMPVLANNIGLYVRQVFQVWLVYLANLHSLLSVLNIGSHVLSSNY